MNDGFEFSQVALPESAFGSERSFGIEYTVPHGDFCVSIATGTEEEQITGFQFAHGNELTLLAALVGCSKRFGMGLEQISSMFIAAASGVFADTSPNYVSLEQDQANRIASGNGFPHHDMHDLGLVCLVPPVPHNPSSRRDGTGIFIDEQTPQKSLVLAYVPAASQPRLMSVVDREARLYEDDISVVAAHICDRSMGEYRRSINAFVTNQFIERLDTY